MKGNEFKLDFIGIGAAKSGTTWLVECLREHPQIFIPDIKEIAFFNSKHFGKRYQKGLNWYERFFKDSPPGAIKGEFTTHYMLFEESHQLIKKHFPGVKIIACLRRPDDAVYSFYWWWRASFAANDLPSTFEEAFQKNNVYLERGLYYKQLRRYFDNFPRKNIKVILFDDIKERPEEVLKDVYSFLGVDSGFVPSVLNKRINRSMKARSKLLAFLVSKIVAILRLFKINTSARGFLMRNAFLYDLYFRATQTPFDYLPMSEETRSRLKSLFRDDIEKLEKLINRDLSSWK